MTGDLFAFIRARYDDEERAARRVLDLESDEFEYEYEWSRHSRHKVSGGSGRTSLPGAPGPSDRLADVDSKRRILDLHGTPDICDPNGFRVNPPHCETVVLLALPFASHPEFQLRWAVG